MRNHIDKAQQFLRARARRFKLHAGGTIWKVATIICGVELLVMLVLSRGESKSSLLLIVTDAALLTLMSSPLIYFWAIAPFARRVESVNDKLGRELQAKAHHAETLTATLAKLDFQKRILDQHAIVSETDVQGIITYANDAFCRISKQPREELLGMNHRIVNAHVHSPEFWQEMYSTLERGDVWQGEVCNKARDGSLYWVQATNSAVRDDRGTLLGYVSIRTDITENKLHQQRLEETQKLLMEATANAEAANQAKSEFLATMSHEIRTPMNGVLGMLGLLSDCELTPEQHKLVITARESADSLLVIINDILDYSKLEAGRIQLEFISFSPSQIMDGVISLLKARADAKNISLELDVAPDLPQWITGDPTRLRQILFNLVGNAIKFTETGSVRTIVSHKSLDTDQIEIFFDIRDTGIGIPKEAKARLFTRFSQADGSTTRKFGGTGLGLAISKQLANMMGGEIGVESILGKGSRFWFTIRATISEEPELAESPAATAYDELLDRKLRILVADDNHVNQMFVSALLTRRGHTVDVVANGVEALTAVRLCQYDIVLMDVQMPEMDGVTATRKIRQLDGPEANIPIVALTANAMSGQREEYLTAGMDDYISKPIDPVMLFSSIVRVCIRSHKYRPRAVDAPAALEEMQATSAARPGIAGGISTPVLDAQRIKDLKQHIDSASFKAAIDGFPAEALECEKMLETAITQNDFAAAGRAVHRLRGMASNFGAAQLCGILAQMEAPQSSVGSISDRLGSLHEVLSATIEQLASAA